MQRREFIGLLGSMAIAAPRNAVAQTPAKVYRLAFVSGQGIVAASLPNAKVLLGALAELGYVLGQNLIFVEPSTVPAPVLPAAKMIEQVKAGNVDIIVATGYPVA